MSLSTKSVNTREDVVDRSGAVAVVGAGPAGLSAARMFQVYDVEYDHFERHSGVGGLWDIDNPGTPMYESAHFISSRDMSGFFDYPMPDSFGDYPTRRQILDYTRKFAAEFGLDERIEFNNGVVSVVEDGDFWLVTPENGPTRRYRGVVCASGTNWHPRLPKHPGQFNGEVRHAVTHHSARDFVGKRVLVVGLGNSGADISCDAAQMADAAFISTRRGYHIIPKHLFGVPADQLDDGQFSLPRWLERPLMTGLLRLIVGDVRRWGLPKPDHRLFDSHPLLNSQLLHHLQHGDISVRPEILRFEGPDVVFVDGSREQIDLVLYATGYEMKIPYVESTMFEWNGDRPAQYLTAFNRDHKNLFTIGFIEINSSAYTLFDNISNMVAQYVSAQDRDPSRVVKLGKLIAEDNPDLAGGLSLIKSARHAGYVDAKAYKQTVARVLTETGFSPLVPGFADRLRKGRTVSESV
ncbi:flavin-containing monooxygenase [Gordonia hydrophobica]|uniref:NAD(P)-binding domain-containing protein n=1 Tax=Gordonia hydrophobica TaxID=40516 RepID=A0ABZ2U570_9ACTN|nr:NAD(P)-binding domain-containing protein [Gordonia hydrophobica]MBM7368163.1 cation diffusion facilitator CzcD-associated flavoprotein CzcO [Gordonia hydrophobica]